MEKNEKKQGVGDTVTRGVFVSGVGSTALRVIDAAIAILMLRWLSVYEYGVYRLAIAAYDFFGGFFLAGLENVVVSDAAADIEKNSRRARVLYTSYFIFLSVVSVVLAAIFYFASDRVAAWMGGEAVYLKIVALLFLLSPFETAYKLRFQIYLDFGWGMIFKIIADTGKLVAIALFFLLWSFDVTRALWSVVIATALPLTATFLGYRRPSLFSFPSFSEIKESFAALFLRHGKWAIVSDFVNNASQNIRPFVVRAFVGIEGVALISVAQNLLSAVKSLFPIREVLTPALPRASDDPARLAAQINRATKYATYVYVGLSIAAALGVPVLVWLLFPHYLPALPFFYILLLGLPFFGFRSVAIPVFYALKAQRVLLIITTVRTILLTVVNVALTYFFGLWGAATEMVLIGIFTTPAYARAIRALLPQWRFRVRELFAFDEYDRAFVKDLGSRIATKAGFRV